MMKTSRLPRLALLLALPLLFAIQLSAQVAIGGAVFDGAGGPLLSGVVYHASTFNVPAGQTLTVQSGAIVKFANGASCTVDGHLAVTASVGNLAYFSSINDDSLGGDTNGNGPSSGAMFNWQGVALGVSGTATLTGLELRFTGSGFQPALKLAALAGTTLTDCSFVSCYTGLDYQTLGLATVTGCSFVNGSSSVINCSLNALQTFTGNSASGNSSFDAVQVNGLTTTGTFTIPANSVMGGAHVLNGSVTIGAGSNVTIAAGVVIKINSAASVISVDGTLICAGSLFNPVVFTDFKDDGYGGDTNKNGPSGGSFSHWSGFVFAPTSSASILHGTVVRYLGSGFNPVVRLNDASPTFESCTFEFATGAGIDLQSNSSMPIVTGCQFSNLTVPITNVSLASIQNFSANSSTACTTSNAIICSQTSFAGTVSIGGDNLIGGVLVLAGSLTTQAGSSLTLDQGAIIKMLSAGSSITVAGLLHCQGSSGEIVFTDFRDDSHGGDTNVNGASSGAATWWRGITFADSADGSVLDQVRVRYSGGNFDPGIRLVDADITLTNSVIEYCYADALSLALSSAKPTVTGCAFNHCDIAVNSLYLESLAGFSGNTATGNGTRNAIRATSSMIGTSVTVTKNQLINGVVCLIGSPTILPAGSLVLGPGVVVKFESSGALFVVNGTLLGQGTIAEPVVFTDIRDDQHAGDTNNNGASNGGAAWWRGLQFSAGSQASVLDHVIVRFGGANFDPGVGITDADITMNHCRISDCFAAALSFHGSAARPSIRNCAFDSNASAVNGARWENLTYFLDNTASGNGSFDSPVIDSALVTGTVAVNARSMLNGAFVTTVAPVIGSGASLTFRQGSVVKVNNGGARFTAGSGSLNVAGTGAEPVVFTVIGDDQYGGDTNKNGPSNGSAAQWRGLAFDGPAPCKAEHGLVRYGGGNFDPGVSVTGGMTSLKSFRVENCFSTGFSISAIQGPMDNLVAFNCGSWGIDFFSSTGNEALRFATVAGCNGGIRIGPGHTGTVESSISWANGANNYSGVTAANLFNSNGSAALAGMNGNIHADPLFVDASPTIGDLTLQQSSPSIDAGNFALGMTVAADHDENSRILDHDLDGTVGADQGAFEFGNWSTSFTGRPVIGESMTFTLNGVPAFGVITIALLDYIYYYPPYGMVLVGSPFTQILQDYAFVNYGYPILIPNDPYAVGYKFGVQMGAAVYGNLAVGNISSLYRATIED